MINFISSLFNDLSYDDYYDFYQTIRVMEAEINELNAKNIAYSEALIKRNEEIKLLTTSVRELQRSNAFKLEASVTSRIELDKLTVRINDLEEEKEELQRQVDGLKLSLELAESVSSTQAFGAELKWTEEIDRLEAEIADLKAANEMAGVHGEEEVLALLNDNTAFKQEIRELEQCVADCKEKIAADEVTISALQKALGESNKCTAALQESILALSQRSSDLHDDVSSKVKANQSDFDSTIRELEEKLRIERKSQEAANAEAAQLRSLLSDKETEFENVLQDLIAARLKLAQVSSDADENRKNFTQMQSMLRVKDEAISNLQAQLAQKKKKLF